MCFSSSSLVRNVLLQIAQDFLVGVLRFENSRPSFILVSSLLMSRILASMAATFSNKLVSLVAFSSSKTLASNVLILAWHQLCVTHLVHYQVIQLAGEEGKMNSLAAGYLGLAGLGQGNFHLWSR